MMWIRRIYQRVGLWIQSFESSAFSSRKRGRPQYKLQDLLAECDETAPYPSELDDWEKAQRVGRELF